jgi:murein DD-endopeptidase MepM/ murein hydrolase activator NlpD
MPQKRIWIFAAILTPLFLGNATAAQPPTGRETSVPRRGVVFLASEIGDSTLPAEVLDFVKSCRINLVVFDFAWITHHWPRTKMEILRPVCEELRRRKVQVAVMYRPRVLSPAEAPIHYAQDGEGKTAGSHNHLCFAHEDSRRWGAAWGTRILAALPSVDTVIVYNLLTPCQCADCREGKGNQAAVEFLKQCRSEWRKIRPKVRIGHVGVGDEYADAVDLICPFVAVNRKEDGSEDVPWESARARLELLRKHHQEKWMAPLLKTCWETQTHNSTADIASTVRSCEEMKAGFLLWYYEWIFHSEDQRYDAKTIVGSLGGDWRRLTKYYASRPAAAPRASNLGTRQTASVPPAAAEILSRYRANFQSVTYQELVALGEPGIEGLAQILHDKSLTSQQRFFAANVLGDIKSSQVVDPLMQALGDSDFNVRRCAAMALGKIGNPSAKPALERLAQSDPVAWRDPQTGKVRFLVREAARDALKLLAGGAPASEEPNLKKEKEIFLSDATKAPPFKPSIKIRRLPWPFPGTFKEQNVWNNYQEPTDIYIHAGLDLLLPAGTEVWAVEDGYAAVIFPDNPDNKTHRSFVITTKKGGNEGWCYTHVDPDSYKFKIGDRVKQGQALGKLVDFYVGKNKGADHLHFHYVRFHKGPTGNVQVENLVDPLFFFDYDDTAAPRIVDPLRFVRKGTLDEFPKGEDGRAAVSGRVEVVAGISDNAYEGQSCNWMAPVVTVEITGESAKPWRKLVLDQRGLVTGKEKPGALYLTVEEGEKWRKDLPRFPGVFFAKVTSTDGDGIIEPSDRLQAWETVERDAAGKPRFPDGVYTVTVRAWDLKGNRAARSATVRVENKKR